MKNYSGGDQQGADERGYEELQWGRPTGSVRTQYATKEGRWDDCLVERQSRACRE